MQLRTLLAVCLVGAAPLAAPLDAWAAGVSVTAATDKQKEDATAAYLAAKEKYEGGKFEDALAGFRASYDIVASPNSHMMIANVLGDLKRHAEAYAEAEVVATEAKALGGDYLTTGKKAQELMDQLRTTIGFVTVSLEPGASGRLRVGGREIPKASWDKPVPVDAGSVEVSLESPSGTLQERATVAVGKTETVRLAAKTVTEPKEPEPSSGGGGGDTQQILRIAGFAAAGLGVVGMVTFAGLGAASQGKFNDLKDQCPGNVCPAGQGFDDTISSGRGLQSGANAMLAIGVIGLAAGAGLITASFLMGDGASAEPKKTEDDARATPRIDVGLGLGSLSVAGRF
ncbi:MAG: hypothetical protein IT373_30885 [Polyangiaceae bacterium]|nr:hypothetical protein [Polyangiaceae bacterium]